MKGLWHSAAFSLLLLAGCMEQRVDPKDSVVGDFRFSDEELSLMHFDRASFQMRVSYPQLAIKREGPYLPGTIWLAMIRLEGGHAGRMCEGLEFVTAESIKSQGVLQQRKPSGEVCFIDSEGIPARILFRGPPNISVKKRFAGHYLINYVHSHDRRQSYEIDAALTKYLKLKLKKP